MRIIYYPYLPVKLVVNFIFPVSPVAKAFFKVAISYNHNRNFTEKSINKKGCPSSSLDIKYSLEKLIEMSGSHRSVSMLNKWAGVVFSLKYETQQLVLIRHDRKRLWGYPHFYPLLVEFLLTVINVIDFSQIQKTSTFIVKYHCVYSKFYSPY